VIFPDFTFSNTLYPACLKNNTYVLTSDDGQTLPLYLEKLRDNGVNNPSIQAFTSFDTNIVGVYNLKLTGKIFNGYSIS
jgi:hypothetical protein